MSSSKGMELNSPLSKRLLIAAQVLALIVYAAALQFLIHTTGGTLFVFTTAAPVLIAVAMIMLGGVLVHHYRRSHSLFVFATFEPGQIVFRQGDEGDCAYFIHSGEVEVLQEEGGKQKPVAVLGKGEYFGEASLIGSAPRNATVRAASRTRAAVLGKDNFLTLLSLMPATQEDVMQRVKERAMKQAAR